MSEDDTTGPADAELLDRIAGRLRQNERFESVVARPGDDPSTVVADYETGYFPSAVDRAYLTIRWFETDDFGFHYAEQYDDGTSWEVRWDRHPNDHNSRGHVHPPPDAGRPAEDRQFSREWYEVLSTVLSLLDDRVESLWDAVDQEE